MQKHKIYMVGYSPGYACWFPLPYNITHNKEDASVAWWVGGCDINPALYKENPGRHTYFCEEQSKHELEMWEYFKDRDVLKVGTCKGLQNLTCYNGGRMVQHSHHPGTHSTITYDGKELECVSLHHQQVIVDERYTGLKEGEDYQLIAHTGKLSPIHLNQNDEDYGFPEDYKEPEIVYFPKTKSWGVQSHPEMMPGRSPFVKYCQDSVASIV